jgi:hypothetical protein
MHILLTLLYADNITVIPSYHMWNGSITTIEEFKSIRIVQQSVYKVYYPFMLTSTYPNAV